MSALSRVLADIVSVVFILLALASVREYRRGRGKATAWGAVAFVSLGFLGGLGLVPQPSGTGVYHTLLWQLAARILIGMIVAIPYFLYKLATTFHRPSARVHRAMTFMTVGVIAIGFALPRIPGAGEPRPAWLVPYTVLILIQWTATSVFAAVWLWRAGAGRPTAPRYRMRLLAIGCAAFNIVVLISSVHPQANPNEPNMVVLGLDLLVAAIFFVGLAPPRVLIDKWRRPEQDALRSVFSDMLTAVSAADVGDRLLSRVVEFVGAEGAALYDAEGNAVASYGSLEETTVEHDEPLRFPLRSGGALVIHSSTYSLLFGADKIPILQMFADWADLALGRSAVVARERTFIANAAHELRTPLTALTGFADLLARERTNMSDEQVDQCIAAMTRQGQRAKDLVNNLLDMAQIERGSMRFHHEDVQLASVVDESVASVPKPVGRIVEIHVPPDIHVHTDRGRLQQVIVNLVTNAYRYGGPSVTVDASVDSSGGVIISVRDDGEGVPIELLPNLFSPFARDATASGAGSGLGLAICRQITNALGGTISYDERSSGARFLVTLPDAA
jgi:signal transduction histidine kinase